MKVPWGAAVLLLVCWSPGSTLGKCPQGCTCPLDSRGRRQVVCRQGNMEDPLPITSMDPHVEVILISAPVQSPNHLTIGPIFQQFSRLEELHIVRSNIPAIGRHTFWGVPTLKVLNLTQNNISHVLDYNFRGLANLQQLHLDDNRIESMPSGTFRFLSELRGLSLARNRLRDQVPRLFLGLGKLQRLDLSGNKIGDLNPEVFKDVQELRILRCRSCGLSSMNTLIYRLLPDLAVLDLGDNEFKYISSDEFKDLRKLHTLELDGNQLPVILDGTFSVQTELKSLNLARNRLAKLTTNAFVNLSSLQELNLGFNKLQKIDVATFYSINESLTNIDLSGNSMSDQQLVALFAVIRKIKELSLTHMGLTDLPVAIFADLDLRYLNLSNNKFDNFQVQILSPVPKLQTLDFSNNRFRGMDERLMIRLENVRNVYFQGNPLSCDLCHIVPLLTRNNKTQYARELICQYPYNLRGRPLRSLDMNTLTWCSADDSGYGYMEGPGVAGVTTNFLGEDSSLGIIAAGVALLILLVATALLVAGLVYTRYHAAHYYTREETRGPEHEAIFENTSVHIGDDLDIKYTILPPEFPPKKKVSISTIDGIVKHPVNGT